MSNAILYRMASGIPGELTRLGEGASIEPNILDATGQPTAFGVFVKLVSGKIRALASGDAATVVYGLNVRSFPGGSSQDPLGTSTPPTTGIVSVLRRGYLNVLLKLGTAVKGAGVYVVTTAGGSVAVGDIVTSTSPAGGGTAVLVAGATFSGPADAQGNVEIAYNI